MMLIVQKGATRANVGTGGRSVQYVGLTGQNA